MVSRIVTDFGIWLTEKARHKFKDANMLDRDYGHKVATYITDLIVDKMYERGIKSEHPIRITFNASENAIQPKDYFSALLLYGYHVPEVVGKDRLVIYTPDQKTRIWLDVGLKSERYDHAVVPKEGESFIVLDSSRELRPYESQLKTEYKQALTGLIESD